MTMCAFSGNLHGESGQSEGNLGYSAFTGPYLHSNALYTQNSPELNMSLHGNPYAMGGYMNQSTHPMGSMGGAGGGWMPPHMQGFSGHHSRMTEDGGADAMRRAQEGFDFGLRTRSMAPLDDTRDLEMSMHTNDPSQNHWGAIPVMGAEPHARGEGTFLADREEIPPGAMMMGYGPPQPFTGENVSIIVCVRTRAYAAAFA